METTAPGPETLRRATPDVIPAIVRLERGPGYDRLVGRPDAAQRAA